MHKKINKITIFSGYNKFNKKEKFKKIEIKQGEVIAIVGVTGSGKSQLLYDIERLAQKDTKSKRKILVNNKVPSPTIRSDPKKKLIASLSQSMNFLTDLNVQNFLQLHLESRGKKPQKKIIQKVIQQANQITGEAIRPKMNLLNLSGGQSRALMVSDVANISVSPIILIDEIENAGIKKAEAIRILVKEGKIILMVTHDPSLALNADKRIIIKDGGIEKIITTSFKEKEIAQRLIWIEKHYLDIREKIRQGEKIKKLHMYCAEI
jgi:ABC-type lipoprotein export system ATPase subunit